MKRDVTASDVLYFKFQVDPLSDGTTEEYFAAFQLFEGDQERLAVGNSPKAWSYSAFNTLETGENNQVAGDMDLRSSRPEVYGVGNVLRYELPRRGIHCTIVFKVRFVPGGDDIVSVWMNPDLTKGATEESQPESLTTNFKARARSIKSACGTAGWAAAGFSAIWPLRPRSMILSWSAFGRRGGSVTCWPSFFCWPCLPAFALRKRRNINCKSARRTRKRAGARTGAHRPGFAR